MEIKNQNVDNVVPKSKWEFDADVAHSQICWSAAYQITEV